MGKKEEMKGNLVTNLCHFMTSRDITPLLASLGTEGARGGMAGRANFEMVSRDPTDVAWAALGMWLVAARLEVSEAPAQLASHEERALGGIMSTLLAPHTQIFWGPGRVIPWIEEVVDVRIEH
jgi:hypothetical protein